MSEDPGGAVLGSDGDLLYEQRDHVAWVTLNRPARLNSLSRSLMSRLVAATVEIATDPEVWVAVFRGAGGRAFCVGADLKERGEEDSSGRRPVTPMVTQERNIYEAVLEIPKPTVACIEGYCVGGGFELALACDLRVASDDASFGLPEAKIGMGANFASVVLPRLLPRGLALEILYLAERFSAEQLQTWGLLNRVWPKADLAARTEAFVSGLTKNAPVTLRRYKEMVLKGWEQSVPTALRLNVGPNPYTSSDRVEGIRAFNEKRAPVWEGR